MAVAGFENAEQEANRRRSFLTDSLWMEKYYPALCAVGVAVIAHRFGFLIPGPEALGAFVGFSAAVAGFAATLLGILFSSKGLWKIRELETAGKFDILKGYVYAAVRSGLLSVALGLALLSCDRFVVGWGLRAPVWLGMAVHTGLCCQRAAWFLFRLL